LAADLKGESLKPYGTRTPGSVAMSGATMTKEGRGDHKMVERAGYCAACYFPSRQILKENV
jgi:hypothetical protein